MREVALAMPTMVELPPPEAAALVMTSAVPRRPQSILQAEASAAAPLQCLRPAVRPLDGTMAPQALLLQLLPRPLQPRLLSSELLLPKLLSSKLLLLRLLLLQLLLSQLLLRSRMAGVLVPQPPRPMTGENGCLFLFNV